MNRGSPGPAFSHGQGLEVVLHGKGQTGAVLLINELNERINFLFLNFCMIITFS